MSETPAVGMVLTVGDFFICKPSKSDSVDPATAPVREMRAMTPRLEAQMISGQRVFSATIILSILVLPLTVASASANSVETVTRPAAPKPEIVEAVPFVITIEPSEVKLAPRPARVAAKAPAKVWTCGDWNHSPIGGDYKKCEWL